jgi:hypothetical protein
MKKLALEGLRKLLNKEELIAEEIDALRLYFNVSYAASGARYEFDMSTPETIQDDFKRALELDITHIFASRYGE